VTPIFGSGHNSFGGSSFGVVEHSVAVPVLVALYNTRADEISGCFNNLTEHSDAKELLTSLDVRELFVLFALAKHS